MENEVQDINSAAAGSNKNNSGSSSSYMCRQSNTRWTPTSDQIRILKELYYNNGIRSPSADQIQRIAARLRHYGKIEGKNVFYWFQNHKARERQKKRFTPTTTTTTQPQPPSNISIPSHQHHYMQQPYFYNHQQLKLLHNISPPEGASSSSHAIIPVGCGYGSFAMENTFRKVVKNARENSKTSAIYRERKEVYKWLLVVAAVMADGSGGGYGLDDGDLGILFGTWWWWRYWDFAKSGWPLFKWWSPEIMVMKIGDDDGWWGWMVVVDNDVEQEREGWGISAAAGENMVPGGEVNNLGSWVGVDCYSLDQVKPEDGEGEVSKQIETLPLFPIPNTTDEIFKMNESEHANGSGYYSAGGHWFHSDAQTSLELTLNSYGRIL
ncbi:hypothetical protein QVD17_05014 [Tagetes erecta]|uniref:Homeobox domain-containing protein n=1 Tax=Tagetes erecta TaxID=13708 RepID=A0AAD8LDP5_TARER|nr:hypothetical protein QVD17_05014 [Tagetes erecta]